MPDPTGPLRPIHPGMRTTRTAEPPMTPRPARRHLASRAPLAAAIGWLHRLIAAKWAEHTPVANPRTLSETLATSRAAERPMSEAGNEGQYYERPDRRSLSRHQPGVSARGSSKPTCRARRGMHPAFHAHRGWHEAYGRDRREHMPRGPSPASLPDR